MEYKNAYNNAPIQTIVSTVLNFLVALIPSAQTILVAKLTSALNNNDTSTALLLGCIVGILVAGYLSIQQIDYTLQRMLQSAIIEKAHSQLNLEYARLEPIHIIRSDISNAGQAAREAINSSKLGMQIVALQSVLFAITVCCSLLITIWSISPLSSAFIFTCLLPLSIATMIYAKKEGSYWDKISACTRQAQYRESVLSGQSTASELSLYDSQHCMAEWANSNRSTIRKLFTKLDKFSILTDGIAGLCSIVLLSCALLTMISTGADTASIAGGIVGVLSGIGATSNVGYALGELLSSSNAVSAYMRFINIVEDCCNTTAIPDVAQQQEIICEDDYISIENMSAYYPDQQEPSISDISFTVKRGEIVGFVGENGAGKTTTIKGLLGMIENKCDRCTIYGHDFRTMGYEQRHQFISVLTQDYGRYELTVRENLLLGIQGKEVSDGALWEALRQAHGDTMVKNMPNGLDTQLGNQWNGQGLSGGEWQRLALARLILRDSPIRIFDEATSNIDAQTEESIFEEIKKDSHEYATIIISHRAWTLRNADRIYVFHNGHIIESGSYCNLSKKGTYFSELFSSQKHIEEM
ncbi:ABC transporter ATP-binding protein [Bifidobacterium hapali]|uniref:ABC transporter ATP-binding protein n=1 Tax=Bifidobacterium hapali TaxID=1630172 RepID=A0A261G0E2_9BIFI|nr:ABC transporter ATP-binding protein [Bifidobacterium hapali]OZG64476.1 ABC transporter ATP-binding protein [Bifidobacterium hapali]